MCCDFLQVYNCCDIAPPLVLNLGPQQFSEQESAAGQLAGSFRLYVCFLWHLLHTLINNIPHFYRGIRAVEL